MNIRVCAASALTFILVGCSIPTLPSARSYTVTYTTSVEAIWNDSVIPPVSEGTAYSETHYAGDTVIMPIPAPAGVVSGSGVWTGSDGSVIDTSIGKLDTSGSLIASISMIGGDIEFTMPASNISFAAP